MGSDNFATVVVGGGFYGARLALASRARGGRVLLVEREPRLLGRASLRNQARVHNGYHYPRSILTSLRSRLNYKRFVSEYADCVQRAFPHYYAIARGTSKVTAAQFAEFCRRIDAPLSVAPQAVSALFDPYRIEAVFAAQECAFDADKLRARLARELDDAGVEIMTRTAAVRITTSTMAGTRLTLRLPGGEIEVGTDCVLNCTYSRLNELLANSGAAIIPAKHELTEMALVEPPPQLAGAAVTVMDGPFFSMMPYPSRGLFTLSHVRYTPHCSWHDANGVPVASAGDPGDSGDPGERRASRYPHMVRDAARYLPAMRSARYVDSLWEVKTLMPRSEKDDSRPILLRRSEEHPDCLTVLGAKIDSVYDVEEALASLLIDEPRATAMV
jgi:glycine/D-amino acid oxidase-like deaminating enzyme